MGRPTKILGLCLLLALLAGWGVLAPATRAQTGGQHPTPMVIELTPTGAAASATPTAASGVAPDRFEPNNDPAQATEIGWQTETGLTLVGADVDLFTAFLKAGQIVEISTAVSGTLDTRLELLWGGQPVAENDDRSATDVGSRVTFAAPADGWFVLRVEKATAADGTYDLSAALVAPTATPTLLPTVTATPTVPPTATPAATPTSSLVSRPAGPPVAPAGGASPGLQISPPPPLTGTVGITATGHISLTARLVGPVAGRAAVATTHVRLLIYYDANNDRQPGPGEGIGNVSVLAVDAQGQRLAQVFTNVQGEAIFNLGSDTVARVIVPFVPGWSAAVRVGEGNNDIVLGLPAVRLPVFLPVQKQSEGEG